MVKVKRYELERSTTAGTDIVDLTDELADQVRASGVRQGVDFDHRPRERRVVLQVMGTGVSLD